MMTSDCRLHMTQHQIELLTRITTSSDSAESAKDVPFATLRERCSTMEGIIQAMNRELLQLRYEVDHTHNVPINIPSGVPVGASLAGLG